MYVLSYPTAALTLVAAFAGPVGAATPVPRAAAPAGVQRSTVANARGSGACLGKILTTKDGGQVFGFAVDQHGTDGVLASAQPVGSGGSNLVSVETFNQDTGKITKSFARYTGTRNSYGVDGIFAGDIGLVTHFVQPKGSIFAKRFYAVMNPVTAKKFTGPFDPTIDDFSVLQTGDNQTTSTSLLFGLELNAQDNPALVVANLATGTVSNVIHLNIDTFGVGNGPQVAQDSQTNQAYIALSPDGGAVHGMAPLNVLVDLSTGQMTQWNGFNNGPFHAGDVNGAAVDSSTGIAATDTELNAQVEFYNLAQQTGTAVQLPCTGPSSQLNSGGGITADSVNHLFLVTDTYYCGSSQRGAIVVYDESGNLTESIPGFSFPIGPSGPAINPSKRMGWATGPGPNKLQQFFY